MHSSGGPPRNMGLLSHPGTSGGGEPSMMGGGRGPGGPGSWQGGPSGHRGPGGPNGMCDPQSCVQIRGMPTDAVSYR
jgi:hypothetical protein